MIIFKKKLFDEILNLKISKFKKAELISDFCRINTLSIIKIAGSGHIGTSMSAMDIFVWIQFFLINKKKFYKKDLNRDIFFSSKGHDVPAMYSVLYSLGILKLKQFTMLRRLNGLDGHPDVSIKSIETNTGSLGMGISKAKGFAWSKKYLNKKGSTFVLTGDGEFQEGQIFESLQTTAHQKLNNIVVIIDHNKIQSSKFIKDVIDLKNLKKKIRSFGWHVDRCNGHSFVELDKVFNKFKKIKNKPKLLIADTIKGKGVKLIEHVSFMKKNKFYTWHSGAPSDKVYNKMINSIINHIKKKINRNHLKFDFFAKKNYYTYTNKNISIDIH